MPERQTTRRAARISTRLRRALDDRQFGCLEASEVLDHATERNVDAIKPYLPDLLEHRDWLVRADAVEFVGAFHVHEFLDAVRSRLHDRNSLVREYALGACYDLLGAKALPLLKRASKDEAVGFRVVALTLRYVESRDEAVLMELRRILLMKRCRFTNRYGALRTFDAYVDVGVYPKIIELFEDVLTKLSESPRKYGLDKDIPRRLEKWRRSARNQQNRCSRTVSNRGKE
jgi:hypothetical protein